MRVGLLQTAVALITILDNYEVSLNLKGEYKPDPSNMFLTPCNNFMLHLKKITVDD